MRRAFLDYHLHTTLMFKAHDIAAEVANIIVKQLTEAADEGKVVDVKATCRLMATGVIGAAIYGNWFLTSPLYRELTALIPKVAAGKQVWIHSRTTRFLPPSWFSAGLHSHLHDYHRLTSVGEELIQGSLQQAESEAVNGDPAAEISKSPLSQVHRRAALQTQTDEFISAMLSEKTMLGESLYDRSAACSSVVALMFHGCLSMSTLCTRALVSIAQNPLVQEQVLYAPPSPPHTNYSDIKVKVLGKKDGGTCEHSIVMDGVRR